MPVKLFSRPLEEISAPLGYSFDSFTEDLVCAEPRAEPWAEQFILKIHSRCNLNCSYCYMYNLKDTSYLNQPFAMSLDTAELAARRIAEHKRDHNVPNVEIILHGGEPLLVGARHLDALCRVMRKPLGRLDTDFVMQTNGTLLDQPDILEVIGKHAIRVGVSEDGTKTSHDSVRLYRDGRGSFDQVAAGIAALQRSPHGHLFAGILCVVNFRADPRETVDTLLQFSPPALDFLLPDNNWDTPPPGHEAGKTPYADWLLAADARLRMHAAKRPVPEVRMLEAIRDPEGSNKVESVGPYVSRAVVIETDGAYEKVDTLKSAYEGATATGMHISRHSIAEVLSQPFFQERLLGTAALCGTCQQCPIKMQCGGGQLAHRYRSGSGYNNPSVYCDDLKKLIPLLRGEQ